MRSKTLYILLIAAIALLLFTLIVYRPQTTRPGAGATKAPTPTVSAPTASVPTVPVMPTVAVEASSCNRPYPDSSIWNVPLDWSIAKIHPMSDSMIAAFFESSDWIGSDTSQYAPNVYWVSDVTPLVPVQLLKNRFRDAVNDHKLQYGQPAEVVWMPLPLNARPAEGTDGQLVV